MLYNLNYSFLLLLSYRIEGDKEKLILESANGI